jgi:hypothetical protein
MCRYAFQVFVTRGVLRVLYVIDFPFASLAVLTRTVLLCQWSYMFKLLVLASIRSRRYEP